MISFLPDDLIMELTWALAGYPDYLLQQPGIWAYLLQLRIKMEHGRWGHIYILLPESNDRIIT